MAVREILIYPNHKEELRRKSDPVKGVSKQARQLIHNLKDTLQASSDGIGLAADEAGHARELRRILKGL